MHDFFEILGVPRGARAPEIIRACRARLGRPHPDFHHGDDAADPAPAPPEPPAADVAVDFANMRPIIDRMRAAFFGQDS